MRGLGRGGVALLVVLGILALLVPLAASLFEQMSQRLAFARHGELDASALELGRSGLELARLVVASDDRLYTYLHHDEAPGFGPDGKLTRGRSREDSKIDQMLRFLAATAARGFALEGGILSVLLLAEEAKVNVNRAGPEQLRSLFGGIGLKRKKKLEILREEVEEDIAQETALSIVNWIRPDGMKLVGGATDEHYQKERPPYRSRGAPMETVEEMLLIKDMTPVIVLGDAARATTGTTDVMQPLALPEPRGPTAWKRRGLSGLLTVFGAGRIDVNHAPRDVLRTLPGVFESQARERIADVIMEKRPFRDTGELSGIVGAVDPAAFGRAAPLLSVRSETFRVIVTARRGVRTRRVEAVLRRQGRKVTTLSYRED